MLLALDVGNTHVVVGLMEGREVRRSFRIATRRDNAVGDYAVALSQLLELAEVDRQAEKLGIVQDILLEVNIGGEEAKSGFAPEDVRAAAQSALELEHVRVLGLMAIPPVETVPHGNMRYFAEMRALYVDINEKMYHNEFKYLSMGMSEDLADAIRAGANMVRVGSAIFGARDYTK